MFLYAFFILISSLAYASNEIQKYQEEFDVVLQELVSDNFTPFPLSVNGPRRYILTGGPGVGKTSILLYLEAALDQEFVREAAADLMYLGQAQGVSKACLFKDFNAKVVKLQEKRQTLTETSPCDVVFFDRSPIDVLTYVRRDGAQIDTALYSIIKRLVETGFYQKTVFLIEHLDHYQQDDSRPENLETSLEWGRLQEEHYRKLGFNICKIPPGSVEERATAIMQIVHKEQIESALSSKQIAHKSEKGK